MLHTSTDTFVDYPSRVVFQALLATDLTAFTEFAFGVIRPGIAFKPNWLSLSETQTRTYWWCSPPKSGTGITRPALWTAREIGASFCSDRCVRTSL